MSEAGHNSGNFAAQQLKHLVERIERLTEEKKGIQADIAEVYAECKAFGYDKKIVRKVVQIREKALAERQEEEALLDLYMSALGMLPRDRDADDDTHAVGAGAPRLARTQPSQAPVGAEGRTTAPEPYCKPSSPATPSLAGNGTGTGEAGESATINQEPSGASMALPPSPQSGPDGAGEGSVAPPATNSPVTLSTPAEAGAGDCRYQEPAPAPDDDGLEIPAFLDRRVSR